jgi:hypothetical protein
MRLPMAMISTSAISLSNSHPGYIADYSTANIHVPQRPFLPLSGRTAR